MSTLTERQAAFESKFAHDEQLKFRVEMRRNKLVGLWAAALLGKDDAEAYAKEVVAADFEEAGNEDVVRKIAADFQAAGITQSADDVREKMAELLGEAVRQVEAG